MKICVIVPAYNEGQAIEALVSGIKAKGLPAVVIDDGSTDGTDAKAAAAGAVVLRSNKNLGKGEALKKGFAYSLDKGFDGAIVMDGDGQHSIEDVDKFLEAAKDPSVSLIVGNRMNDTRRMPALRAFTNRLMSRMVSKLSGQTVPDSQCGFRLLKKDLIEISMIYDTLCKRQEKIERKMKKAR